MWPNVLPSIQNTFLSSYSQPFAVPGRAKPSAAWVDRGARFLLSRDSQFLKVRCVWVVVTGAAQKTPHAGKLKKGKSASEDLVRGKGQGLLF